MHDVDIATVDPALAFRLRAAADWYGWSVDRYVKYVLRENVATIADTNPVLREVFDRLP